MSMKRTLINGLKPYAERCELDESLSFYIVNNFIRIDSNVAAGDQLKNRLVVKSDPLLELSYDIQIDFKRAVFAGVKMAEAVYMPAYVCRYIRLLLTAVALIRKEELPGELETYIIYILHVKRMRPMIGKWMKTELFVRCGKGMNGHLEGGRNIAGIMNGLAILSRMKVVVHRRTYYRLNSCVYGRVTEMELQ